MILYNPTDGVTQQIKVNYRPKTCFVMTQLGKPVSPEIIKIRKYIKSILDNNGIAEIDASSVFTGKDFMYKIWQTIVSVPLGIAVIDDTISKSTLSNIFYEIGLMHALGKETIVVKTEKAQVPSDFVRTEYIDYGRGFTGKMNNYFSNTYSKLPDYFETMADSLEKNPLLSIDYLRRAYLISGNTALRRKAHALHKAASINNRAKNSVEELLLDF